MPSVQSSTTAPKDAYDLLGRYEFLAARKIRLKEETNAVVDQLHELEAQIVKVIKDNGKDLIAGDRIYRSDGFRVFGSDALYAVSIPIEPPPSLDGFGGETADQLLARLKAQGEAAEKELLTSYRAVEEITIPEPAGKDA